MLTVEWSLKMWWKSTGTKLQYTQNNNDHDNNEEKNDNDDDNENDRYMIRYTCHHDDSGAVLNDMVKFST